MLEQVLELEVFVAEPRVVLGLQWGLCSCLGPVLEQALESGQEREFVSQPVDCWLEVVVQAQGRMGRRSRKRWDTLHRVLQGKQQPDNMSEDNQEE